MDSFLEFLPAAREMEPQAWAATLTALDRAIAEAQRYGDKAYRRGDWEGVARHAARVVSLTRVFDFARGVEGIILNEDEEATFDLYAHSDLLIALEVCADEERARYAQEVRDA